eukprot:gene890-971_t
MSSSFEIKSTVKVHGGQLIRFSHPSKETKTTMTCAVFLPDQRDRLDRTTSLLPSLLYLSGLTCTDENVCQKGSPYKALVDSQVAFIAPDTSPRGAGITGEDDSWDFGSGAGFYLDAVQTPWDVNYRMYSYIVEELPEVLAEHFPCLDPLRRSITGHSMGGHGALTIALKNPTKFKSVSAFAPICNPSNCPWGIKAFTGYLGEDRSLWAKYDATELIKIASGHYPDILLDVGTADSFYLNGQLLPEKLIEAAGQVGQKITLRMQEGYDHSYYFISTFIADHIAFHARYLK